VATIYPETISQAPFASMWHEIPELKDVVDPFDIKQRMGVFKLLIDSTNQNGIFGQHNELNCFWGYLFQTHWQWRSGRYTIGDMPQQRIAPDSIWGYSNFSLSVIPMIAAIQAGLIAPIEILPPKPSGKIEYATSSAKAGEYHVPAVFSGALAEWRSFFELLKSIPRGGDIEPIRYKLWDAHGSSLIAAAEGNAILGSNYSRNEVDFLGGWVRMVDFLATAAWRTDIEYMLKNGLDVLPERMLTDDDIPGQVPDMDAEVNANLKSMFELIRQADWRFNINLWMWKRAMRTRAARDEVLPMLGATFRPSPENVKERQKLLMYMLKW
jgi:hypothetical protein